MTTDTFPELQALRVEVEPETRDRHLAEIGQAVRALGPVRPRPRWGVGWQRWAVATAAAAVLLVPAGAIAADDALPGDILYPVKRFVEPVVRLFDSDVVAEHRVEELERLVDIRPDAAVDLLPEARDAVDEIRDTGLTDRLDAVMDSLFLNEEARPAVDRSDHDADTAPPDNVPVESDQPVTRPEEGSVTDEAERVGGFEDTDTTTTTTAADADRPLTDGHDHPPADAPSDEGATEDEAAISDSSGDRPADAPDDGQREDQRDTP